MNKIEKETIKRYDEIAEAYNKDWRGEHDKVQLKHLEEFEKALGFPQKKILDAGCGTGKDCIYFASHGYDIYGVDLSKNMLKKAIEKFRINNLNGNLLIGDMRTLNFPSNYFDGVWSAAAIVHLPFQEKRKAIREFYRVLKPKGILHFWVQNLLGIKHLVRLSQSYVFYLQHSKANIIEKIHVLKERIKMGYAFLDDRHWFYPTKKALLKMLKEEGFLILKTNHMFSRRLSVYAQKRCETTG